ncbi:MAG TPA: hypothetical protein VK149_04335 [Sideroxyarcus sp.]|nr:hypothetical protein [Sideroxyarcus sp.]
MAKKYTFTHNGDKFEIPSFSALPVGVIRKARRAKDEADQAFTILETVMGEDSPELAAVDSMTTEEFQAFIKGWTEGASVGESVSSES